MKLRSKLILFFSLFAGLPVLFFGAYLCITGYMDQKEASMYSLTDEVETVNEQISNYFRGSYDDIEFVSHMAEVKNLLSGMDMEDMDEVAFWTEGLTSALSAFLEKSEDFP